MEEPKAPSSSAERQKPLTFALKRLARRSHGVRELAAKMSRAGYSEDEIRPTLAYLEAKGYLDDETFAREVARASSERKHWGPLRIQRKLRELRLEEGDIEGALEESFPEGEEEAAARAFERFRRAAGGRRGERARARAYRHLLGRGFSPEVVHRLVSAWIFEDTERDQE